MLTAQQGSFWARAVEIARDGASLTTFNPTSWGSGGRFALDGVDYELRSNLWGASYALATDDGDVLATAERVGRKEWTVQADGTRYTFRRTSFWKADQTLIADDRPIGVVRRTSPWKLAAEADLPGLSLPVQVFVVAVVVTMWRRQAAGAAGG